MGRKCGHLDLTNLEHLTLKTVLVGLSVLVASIGFAAGRASAETITLSNLGTVSSTTDGALLGPGVFLTGPTMRHSQPAPMPVTHLVGTPGALPTPPRIG